MEHDVLTPREVSEMLRVDPKTVARWAKDGLLPHFKTPGGHRRFHRADVEKFTEPPAGSFRLTPLPSPGNPPAAG